MASSGHMWISKRFFIATLLSVILSAQCVQASEDEQEKACSNIDIRNSVKNFKRLNNCTVVEGFLRILLIEKAQPQDYYNLSFPKLTEITGYLLLYRASGLVSLADMFPNLAVIRGKDLFHNFAVVIFEMSHLQEIGLKSLTDILRGSLFILKNPNLCYLQTVDWSLILSADKEHNTIRQNKDPKQCPDTCPSHCPKNPHCQLSSSNARTDMSCILCWNSQCCQKVCNETCSRSNYACNNDNPSDCCHRECLGGCTGRYANNCKACRNVFFDNKCMEKCPHNTYQFKGRRCLIEQDCIAVNATEPNKERKIAWKPIQGECRSDCPTDYTVDEKDPHKCIKCKNKCPKVCVGELIDNVATAQKFKGCTIIEGSLIIQVNGAANIIKELEDNLQSITEIRGSLKVSRSFPLVSLNFLKNLEVIRGDKLERDVYALVVMENQNLQELWDWKTGSKNLTITKGKIFFHFNAKLCYDKIIDFYKRVYGGNNKVPEGNDVSNSTNGDRVACDVANLNLTVKVDSKMVIVSWASFSGKVEDRRSLLGYVVYIKEAPYRNVSIFDGRDACRTDVWKIIDVDVGTNNEDSKIIKLDKENQRVEKYENASAHPEFCLIPNLKPFTQYAIFVRTYTTASEKKGARSDIHYFKTLTFTPSQPTNVEALSLHWSNITINWKPPKEPRGIITHYLVTVTEQKDSQDYMNQRDFCLDSRQHSAIKKITPVDHPVVNTNVSETLEGDCCACPKKNPKLEKEEEITNIIINFEDFLHNNVYVKNPDSIPEFNKTKTTRSISEKMKNAQTSPITTPSTQVTAEFTHSTTANFSNFANITSTEAPINTRDNFTQQIWSFDVTVASKERGSDEQFTKVVTGLKHFTEYSIEIRACQDIIAPVSNTTKINPPCSTQAIVNVRTLRLGGADDISNSSVMISKENCSDGSAFVKWDEPVSPNGLIVSYHLQYRSVDKPNGKPYPECITQSQYAELRGYLLKNILPGKYFLEIKAMSIAGEGNWTAPIEFEIDKYDKSTESFVYLSFLSLGGVVLAICIFLGIYSYRKKSPNTPAAVLYASVNPEYMSAGLVYEADEWEVPREKITMIRELGQGSFGMVYEGTVIDQFPGQPVLRCAVKTVNECASLREQIEFLQEASIMKAFKCHHVVKLHGVVSKGNPTLVIMELMAHGDLKSYLRSLRPDDVGPIVYPTLTLTEIYKMALQIADGMAYLGNKKYVHRDLAARNCMVDDNITVKIGDFGMTRDIYETDYYRKGGKGLLPVRWMAPESLKDGVFTFYSDVWSYGIVLWEMVTLASQPYQGLSNEQVLKYVILGNQMEEPENCPPLLFELMQKCWVKVPEGRPSFVRIIDKLLPEISNNAEFREKSFFFNHDGTDNDNGESATPATPLRTSYDTNHGNVSTRQNVGDRDSVDHGNGQYKNFPSGSISTSECRNNITSKQGERLSMAALNDFCTICGRNCNGSCITSNDDNASLVEEGNGTVVVNLNNGSKGSKVSSVSNGSLANGHLHMPSGRTTIC